MMAEGRRQEGGDSEAGRRVSMGGRLGMSLLMGASLTRISVVVADGEVGD